MMKHNYSSRLLPGLAGLLAAALPLSAQTLIHSGHVDVVLAYYPVPNTWDLHMHDEETHSEYNPPTDALIVVGLDALTTVPAGPQWSFLGSPGGATWILASTEVATLPYVGLSTGEIAPGVFVGDSISLRLTGVTGPGHFAMFDLDSFGEPVVLMNSLDGISLGDTTTLPTGSHLHYNWAFSQLGDYRLTFEASGNSVLHGPISSGNVDYLFRVIPEPSSFALVALGLATLAVQRRKSRI